MGAFRLDLLCYPFRWMTARSRTLTPSTNPAARCLDQR